MAGHSKWANIQHRKCVQDAKRGKLFTKLIREITISTRMSGSDANSNSRLRAAIDKALANNMTKDTVERAIKRGVGALDGDNYEEIRYEGYGPGGVAVLVDCMTDNRKRTVSEVRHIFDKCSGNLGSEGSVGYLFKRVGQLSYPKGSDEDRIMEVAIEVGADDIIHNDDDSIDVLTTVEAFETVKAAIIKAKLPPEQAEVTLRPSTYITLELEDAQKMLRLFDLLEDLDDVQHVYSNADIAEDIIAKIQN